MPRHSIWVIMGAKILGFSRYLAHYENIGFTMFCDVLPLYGMICPFTLWDDLPFLDHLLLLNHKLLFFTEFEV